MLLSVQYIPWDSPAISVTETMQDNYNDESANSVAVVNERDGLSNKDYFRYVEYAKQMFMPGNWSEEAKTEKNKANQTAVKSVLPSGTAGWGTLLNEIILTATSTIDLEAITGSGLNENSVETSVNASSIVPPNGKDRAEEGESDGYFNIFWDGINSVISNMKNNANVQDSINTTNEDSSERASIDSISVNTTKDQGSMQPSTRSLLQSLKTNNMKQICFIENTVTDTQCIIWADMTNKKIVVAFRGTELVRFQDILIDVNILQVPYFDDVSKGIGAGDDTLASIMSQMRVHAGFFEAFSAVREAVLQQLDFAMTSNPSTSGEGANAEESDQIVEPWEILVTGHSLGGALATLLTFELSRLQQQERQRQQLIKLSESPGNATIVSPPAQAIANIDVDSEEKIINMPGSDSAVNETSEANSDSWFQLPSSFDEGLQYFSSLSSFGESGNVSAAGEENTDQYQQLFFNTVKNLRVNTTQWFGENNAITGVISGFASIGEFMRSAQNDNEEVKLQRMKSQLGKKYSEEKAERNSAVAAESDTRETNLARDLPVKTNKAFVRKLQNAKVITYTYGAPRVGNKQFIQVRFYDLLV